ncbi:MAG: response regulator transcription factor [Phascolarctobacterium sp.]|nr:response regulator transcription factor [Phascolarctobacterium sp.]
MLKILLVDDQKVLLDAFVNALSKNEDFEIVGSLTEARLADIACQRLNADVVLLDICTDGGLTGLEAIPRIKENSPHTKIIIMTGFPEMSFLERAQKAGADSFIYKSNTMEEFVDCIRKTAAGERCYPDTHKEYTFGSDNEVLTERELEVLRYFSEGMSRKEIADKLFVSTSTVNYHINNMLIKTGYKNLIGLALEAANKGYINTKV